MAVSMILQSVALAVLLIYPLLNYYELDLGAWAFQTVSLAPPPPPAPRPAAPPPAAPAPPRTFVSEFRAPTAIPDKVALVIETGTPVLTPTAVAGDGGSGIGGGDGLFGLDGIPGMIPTEAPLLPPPIRIGGNIQNARITNKVAPVYPEKAILENVSGVVKLEAIIDIHGAIRDLTLMEGHPMLVPAAIEAVSQWRYRPTRLNGLRVEVVTLIDVRFNLMPTEEEGRKGRRRKRR